MAVARILFVDGQDEAILNLSITMFAVEFLNIYIYMYILIKFLLKCFKFQRYVLENLILCKFLLLKLTKT